MSGPSSGYHGTPGVIVFGSGGFEQAAASVRTSTTVSGDRKQFMDVNDLLALV